MATDEQLTALIYLQAIACAVLDDLAAGWMTRDQARRIALALECRRRELRIVRRLAVRSR